MDIVRREFKINPEHMYMSGFSMGCSGAWALAARKPELWAGVQLASGFGDWSDTAFEYLADNMLQIPLQLWIGELDGMLAGAKEFHKLLESKNCMSQFIIAENVSHTYPYDCFQKNPVAVFQGVFVLSYLANNIN